MQLEVIRGLEEILLSSFCLLVNFRAKTFLLRKCKNLENSLRVIMFFIYKI